MADMTSVVAAPDAETVANAVPPTDDVQNPATGGLLGRFGEFQSAVAGRLQTLGSSVAGPTGSAWAIPLVIVVVAVAIYFVARGKGGKSFKFGKSAGYKSKF